METMTFLFYDDECSVMTVHGSAVSNGTNHGFLLPRCTPADGSLYRERVSLIFADDVPWTVFSMMSGNSDHVTQAVEVDTLARIRAVLVEFDVIFGDGWDFVVEDKEFAEK